MKLVVVNSGSVLSGAEIILRQYLESLFNSEVKVSLVIAKQKHVLDFFKKINPYFPVYTVPFFVKKKLFLSRVINFFMLGLEVITTAVILAKNEQVDVVYCNNTIACVVVGLINKFRIGRYKTVFHVYDTMSVSSFRSLFKFVAASCEQVVAASNTCKEDLVKCTGLSEEKVQVIYNGVELQNTVVDSQGQLLASSSIVIGFAGSITTRKGLIYLLEAYKVLRKRHSHLKLLMAYNFAEPKYEQVIDAILDNLSGVEKVSLTTEEMPSFYKSIDILVVPSLNDPLPTTVLEALSFGKIVIGSNIDGIPEMVEQKYLFAPANSKAIVEKLEFIIDDYAMHKAHCKQYNPEVISSRFSLEKKNKLISELLFRVAYDQKYN